MLVKYWMRTPAATVEADARLAEAEQLMDRTGFRMLPVLAGGRLDGVVTRSALRRAAGRGPAARVRQAMIRGPVHVPLYHTLEEAAVTLLGRGVRAAPVTDPAGGVAGVIGVKEMLQAMAPLLGAGRKGVQLALRAEDRPGAVREVTDSLLRHGGRILSLLTRRGDGRGEGLEIYMRLHGLEPSARQRLKEELRSRAGLLYVVDHEAAEREIAPETTGGTKEKGGSR